jgi:hypothetical protein
MYIKKQSFNPYMGYTPIILALKRQRQEDHELETSLGYIA